MYIKIVSLIISEIFREVCSASPTLRVVFTLSTSTIADKKEIFRVSNIFLKNTFMLNVIKIDDSRYVPFERVNCRSQAGRNKRDNEIQLDQKSRAVDESFAEQSRSGHNSDVSFHSVSFVRSLPESKDHLPAWHAVSFASCRATTAHTIHRRVVASLLRRGQGHAHIHTHIHTHTYADIRARAQRSRRRWAPPANICRKLNKKKSPGTPEYSESIK